MPFVNVSNCSNDPSVFSDSGRLPRHAIPDIRMFNGLLLRSPRGGSPDSGTIVREFIIDTQ